MSAGMSDTDCANNFSRHRLMQNLSEKVYECTLAVEAHMICDLLTRAGIPARVDGALLTGAGGELPLGNTVNVRVAPERAAEAREVIADWEKQQTGDEVPAVTGQPRAKALLWFGLGAAFGLAIGVVMANSIPKQSIASVDYNGDGRDDTVTIQVGSMPRSTTIDRNLDGLYDSRWVDDLSGREGHYEADDDFDGRFEWQAQTRYGELSISTLDLDGDGGAEQIWRFEHGVIAQVDHFASAGHVAKREHFKAGLLDSAEFDVDGNGVFERLVRYDRFGEPAL